jgi:hypothetical protein
MQALALVELAVDAALHVGVGQVAQDEQRPDKAAVLDLDVRGTAVTDRQLFERQRRLQPC